MASYCGTKEGSRCWCNADIGGIIPFEFGECTLFFALFYLSKHVIFTVTENVCVQAFLMVLLLFLYVMSVVSHFRCCFSDPGAVPTDAMYLPEATDDEKLSFCIKCNSFKPPRAHHCSQCNRCIVRMDHHCPWVNNCVGYKNMKYFILFLLYVMILCVYTLILLIVRLVYSYKHIENEPVPIIVATMATMSLAIVFLFFTTTMLQDALSSIRSNTTAIDRLKGLDYADEQNAFGDYFGDNGKFHLSWLFPVSPRFKYLEEIRGYCIHSVVYHCFKQTPNHTRKSKIYT